MSSFYIWLIGVLGAMIVAVLVLLLTKARVSQFGDFGQGLGGVAAAVGILLGGALFIAEGRTQPRLLLQVTSTVIGASAASGPQESVYVQVVTTIENQGQISPATIECAAFDAFGIAPSGSRDANHANDLALQSLLRDAAHHGRHWEGCLRSEAAREGASYVRPDSGFRWAPFEIRPGQIKTRNYEMLVSCDLGGLRIIVKIPDPAGGVQERKVAISIVDVCQGDSTRDVTTVADAGASSSPVRDGADSAATPPPAEPSNQSTGG